MKFAIVLGTRPEIIKFSSIIHELQKRNLEYILIHTNQHYSENMDALFMEQLEIPKQSYDLGIGSLTANKQISKILISLSDILEKEKPDVVLVQGDTNSTLGGALVSCKRNIPIAHIEAGLRSFDRTMPEEINRIITDHISTFLFPPTQNSRNNLLKEGISKNKIYVVGNTIVDSLNESMKKLKRESSQGKYILVTLHRQENVDNVENLRKFIKIIKYISMSSQIKIIFPIHPRTINRIKQYDLLNQINALNIEMVEPLGYFEFLSKQNNAELIVTDSGGIQEEACILGVPCITLRNNTERPETLEVGSNVITGLDIDKFRENFTRIIRTDKVAWENPYGEGHAGKKIIDILLKELS